MTLSQDPAFMIRTSSVLSSYDPSSNLNLFGPGDFVGVPGEYESSCIKITITDTIIAPSARWCA